MRHSSESGSSIQIGRRTLSVQVVAGSVVGTGMMSLVLLMLELGGGRSRPGKLRMSVMRFMMILRMNTGDARRIGGQIKDVIA